MNHQPDVVFPKPHPLRKELANELHARPSVPLKPPAVVLRVALATDETTSHDDRKFVEDLCHRFNAATPALNSRWHAARLGDVFLRWERHTELSTLTLHWATEKDHERFASKCPPGWPANWLEGAPGSLLSAVHMEIVGGPAPTREVLAEQFGEDLAVIGSPSAKFFAATTFRLDEDGYCPVAVWSDETHADELGRKLQKLLEIETYRMAALLSFPAAINAREAVSQIEADIGEVMSELVDTTETTDDAHLLARVSELSAKAEAMQSRTSYRFAAGRAYHRLVKERLGSFDTASADEPREAMQTYSVFLARRLEPAMRTCDAVEERLHALVKRIARATNLLATRVDVRIGEQNAEVLKSLNQRTEAQLKLQETVEGLSVFAISYYAVGLLSYLAKAAYQFGLPVKPEILTAAAVPLVMGLLWFGLNQLKARFGKHLS